LKADEIRFKKGDVLVQKSERKTLRDKTHSPADPLPGCDFHIRFTLHAIIFEKRYPTFEKDGALSGLPSD